MFVRSLLVLAWIVCASAAPAQPAPDASFDRRQEQPQAFPGVPDDRRGLRRQKEVEPKHGGDAAGATGRDIRTAGEPSRFQRFVEAATGRLLPVFGAQFFRDAAGTVNPTQRVPAASDYAVRPGDEVITRAWGSVDVDYRATVDRDGMLHLPRIGSFKVAGVKAADLERHLRAQIGRLFTNFNLSVSLGQLRSVTVFVVGPVERPGVYTLPGQSTMLSALVAAGGPSPIGSMRKVSLRRDERIVSELDVYDFLVFGDKSNDAQLVAGDVVTVQPVGPQVAVTGAVDARAICELRAPQEALENVLRYAGGALVLTNPSKVQLERITPDVPLPRRSVQTFGLDAVALVTDVRDGDILTLLDISPQFANAVTLRGHVARPLRYAYKPGMRVRDLIPDAEALVPPDYYRRKNLLVQVAPADDPGLSGEPRKDHNPAGSMVQDAQQRAQAAHDRRSPARAHELPPVLFEGINWDYATIERLGSDLQTQVIAFNLRDAVVDGDEAANLPLAAGDVLTVYSQKEVRSPVLRQTRLVSIEGEVHAPGTYPLQPGETLRDAIRRAGGVTPHAYLFGLELRREETRARQRANLTAAISKLRILAAEQAARTAANRRDERGFQARALVSDAAMQAQISRLAGVQPNGRIALELDPDLRDAGLLPAVPLEGGDRIVVPTRPGFVTVAGSVLSTNALVWKPARTTVEYLELAGLEEGADVSAMFILRADGTVVRASQNRVWPGGRRMERSPVYPGDAIVVPAEIDLELWGRAVIRDLKEISQIFSQFGVTAALLNSVR